MISRSTEKYIVEVEWDGRTTETRCYTLSGARDQKKLTLVRYPYAKIKIFEVVEVE